MRTVVRRSLWAAAGLALCAVLTALGYYAYQYVYTPQYSKPVARVYNQYLYPRDMADVAAAARNSAEKKHMQDRYIKSWITKQLLIAEAERSGAHNEAELAGKILDYKYALIAHSYLHKRSEDRLNTQVEDGEIEAYYAANKKDFELRSPVLKVCMVVVPRQAPQRYKLLRLMASTLGRDAEALQKYCTQFAQRAILDTAVWYTWEQVTRQTPFEHQKPPVLRVGRLLEAQDEKYVYYIRVCDYKLARDVSPLSLVKERIVHIILHKRRVALAAAITEEIWQQAAAERKFEMYE